MNPQFDDHIPQTPEELLDLRKSLGEAAGNRFAEGISELLHDLGFRPLGTFDGATSNAGRSA